MSSPEPSAFVAGLLHEVVAVVLPDFPDLDPQSRREVEREVSSYLAGQIEAMAGHLRAPYKIALLTFEMAATLRYARRFRSLPVPTRRAYLAAWDTSPLLPMRDFLKLIRSTALLAYFDHPRVRAQLEAQCAPLAPLA